MAGEVRIGEAVLCKAASYSEQLDIAGRSGLVVEKRRSRANVLFVADGRTIWVPLNLLRRYAPGTIPESETLGRLWRLIAFFGHVQHFEVEIGSPERQIVVFHGAVDVATIDAIRSHLGTELRSVTLAPAGMHRIATTIRWIAPPPIEEGNAPSCPPS